MRTITKMINPSVSEEIGCDAVNPVTELSVNEKRFIEKIKNDMEFIRPYIYQMDRNAVIDGDVLHMLREKGYFSLEIEKRYGGLEMSFFNVILAIEHISAIDSSVGAFVDVQNTLVNNVFTLYGNEEQKEKYLKMLASDSMGAFAITEKQAGSNVTAMESFVEEKEDCFILNGDKHWITSAKEADIFVVFANTLSGKRTTVSAFILERGMDGFSIGESYEKTGIRASSTCDLTFDNVRIPKENLLTVKGNGLRIAMNILEGGRLGIAAQTLGLAEGAFEETVKYTNSRVQSGNAISSYQGVNFRIAQIATEIEAAKTMLYNITRKRSINPDFTSRLHDASMAKLFCSQVADRTVSQCVELIGCNAYMKENPVEKFYRDVKIGTIYEGTANVQLMTIAKKYCKRSRA